MDKLIRVKPSTLHMLKRVKEATDAKSYSEVIQDLLLNIIKLGDK